MLYTLVQKKRVFFLIDIVSWKRLNLELKYPKYVKYVPELYL